MPRLTHPGSPHPIEVTPDRLAVYLTQGWVEVTPTKKAVAKKAVAKKAPAKKAVTPRPAPGT